MIRGYKFKLLSILLPSYLDGLNPLLLVNELSIAFLWFLLVLHLLSFVSHMLKALEETLVEEQ
jgi:hypothetical protein